MLLPVECDKEEKNTRRTSENVTKGFEFYY